MNLKAQITERVAELFGVGKGAVTPLNHFLFSYAKDGRHYVARVNRYQNAIENDVPVLHIDFGRFC